VVPLAECVVVVGDVFVCGVDHGLFPVEDIVRGGVGSRAVGHCKSVACGIIEVNPCWESESNCDCTRKVSHLVPLAPNRSGRATRVVVVGDVFVCGVDHGLFPVEDIVRGGIRSRAVGHCKSVACGIIETQLCNPDKRPAQRTLLR